MCKEDYVFTFHNVGQGLFYTGRIGDFNFVYDCGSRSLRYVKAAIERYYKSFLGKPMVSYFWGKPMVSLFLGKPVVSLLVISHLDKDHVSGLNYFFKLFTVNYVILPYIPRTERLLLGICANYVKDDWYFEFLADPVKFLFRQGVQRVYLVVPGESGEGEDKPDRNKEDANDGFVVNLRAIPEHRAKETIEDWSVWASHGEKLVTVSHNGNMTLSAIWEFVLFVKQSDQTLLRDFRCCASKMLADCSSIQVLLSNKEKRAKLRRCYRCITKKTDINATSLVMYHGPLFNPGWITVDCGSRTLMNLYAPNICDVPKCPCCLIALVKGQECGQLLMGDLDLKKHCEELVCHIGEKKMESTSICLVPHHGSKHSWNAALMEKTKNCRLWVASAGIRNAKYQHPHGSVIKDITKKGRAFWWVNENSRLEIRFKPRV